MGFGVWGLGFGVWGLGFGVWGLGFRTYALGFRLSVGSRLRVEGFGAEHPLHPQRPKP